MSCKIQKRKNHAEYFLQISGSHRLRNPYFMGNKVIQNVDSKHWLRLAFDSAICLADSLNSQVSSYEIESTVETGMGTLNRIAGDKSPSVIVAYFT